MKPTRKIPKLESKWAIAVKLGAHFGVDPNSAIQWFETGCPLNFKDAVKWKETRIEETKIKKDVGAKSKWDRAREQSTAANSDINWDILSPEYTALCDIVCDLFLVGLSTRAIEERLGTQQSVITRIITNHPRTKDRDKEMASQGWADIRRLAQGEIRERLSDPVERSKIKVGDLNFLAGTADDKLSKVETPKEVTLSIKAKIEMMSYEELLKSLPSQKDIIDAEYQIESEETSVPKQLPEIKQASQSQ